MAIRVAFFIALQAALLCNFAHAQILSGSPGKDQNRGHDYPADSAHDAIHAKCGPLQIDTVLFQDIWVDKGGYPFFVTPEGEELLSIDSPFTINGKPFYNWLCKHEYDSDALPTWIIPDFTLIKLTWWCEYAEDTFCNPVTAKIETIEGDPSHWRERFHRPAGITVKYDTGIFEGFMPSDKYPPAILVSGNSNKEWETTLRYGFDPVAPPLLIDGKSYYRQIVNPPENADQEADAVIGIMKATKGEPQPCPGCPPNLIPGHTRIVIPIGKGVGCDEIRILK